MEMFVAIKTLLILSALVLIGFFIAQLNEGLGVAFVVVSAFITHISGSDGSKIK